MKSFLKVYDQITIHLPKLEFAEEIFEIISNQQLYLGEWLPWVERTKSVKYLRAFLKDAARFNQGGQKLTTYVLYDGKIAGSVSFVKIDKEMRTAELGYWLREELQGKGIMTKACQRLIDYNFRTKAINRIEIKVATNNGKSIKIPERMGFLHEGTLRQAAFFYNQYFDMELFSLLKDDWLKMKNE